MARNFYLSELDFRNLTTVKGISVDLISQISRISPSTIRKAVREKKVDEHSLENIARAICSIDKVAPYQNLPRGEFALRVKKRIKEQNTNKIKENFKNFYAQNSEVFKMHLVLRRLSPNYAIKECELNLVTKHNLLSFVSSIEKAHMVRLGTKLEFKKSEETKSLSLLINLIEEYLETTFDNKTSRELYKVKTGRAGIVSNSSILQNSLRETKFKEIVELVNNMYESVNIYFSSVNILSHFDSDNNQILKKYRELINFNKGNIKVISANYLIISISKVKRSKNFELLDIDPYKCIPSILLHTKQPLLELDQDDERQYQIFKSFNDEAEMNDASFVNSLINLAGLNNFIVNSEKDMLKTELFSRLTLATLHNGFYKE